MYISEWTVVFSSGLCAGFLITVIAVWAIAALALRYNQQHNAQSPEQEEQQDSTSEKDNVVKMVPGNDKIS